MSEEEEIIIIINQGDKTIFTETFAVSDVKHIKEFIKARKALKQRKKDDDGN